MAFKLSRNEEAQRDRIRDDLIDAREALNMVIAEQEANIRLAYAAINKGLEEYNETLETARGFVEDIISDRESEFDDKSERWQDGDRGVEAREWIDSLQEVCEELTALDPIEFDDEYLDPEDHADKLDNLPTEAG